MNTNIKINQEMLSHAVESVVNAEAAVKTHLNWIGERKRMAVIEKIKDQTYRAYNLISDAYCDRGVDPAAMMKPVCVEMRVNSFDLIESIKNIGSTYRASLLSLYITFMQDPEVHLGSKKKLTDAEKKLLKDLGKYYTNSDLVYKRDDKVTIINSNLKDLKHNINIATGLQWSFSLGDILDPDFLRHGLKTDKINLW